jgi:hypothetical protein
MTWDAHGMVRRVWRGCTCAAAVALAHAGAGSALVEPAGHVRRVGAAASRLVGGDAGGGRWRGSCHSSGAGQGRPLGRALARRQRLTAAARRQRPAAAATAAASHQEGRAEEVPGAACALRRSHTPLTTTGQQRDAPSSARVLTAQRTRRCPTAARRWMPASCAPTTSATGAPVLCCTAVRSECFSSPRAQALHGAPPRASLRLCGRAHAFLPGKARATHACTHARHPF